MGILVCSNNKKIAGVCAGIAEHFGWNVGTLRLVWFLLAIFAVGAPVLFYLILWFIMPAAGQLKEDYAIRMEKRLGKK
ncbi:MAG: PspC domain-containing protein [Bacteroidaceae bacterium]|nr:PspC domain-containing protein [Bacteroidaceae bacterium]